MLCYVAILSHLALLFRIMIHCSVLRYAKENIPEHVYHIKFFSSMSHWCVMLYYVVLCYALLFVTVLDYVVLCCVIVFSVLS